MEKVNILLLLIPKAKVSCLVETMNVRQALEKMRANGYMAVPLISKNGEYLGTISEGDLLWRIVEDDDIDLEELEEVNIKELVREEYTPPLKVDATMDQIINMITEQNFIPVVDDRNILMGIVTRRRVLQQLLGNDKAL